jgi:predicted DNA-binding transcriptional regulator AlpA
MQDTTEKTEAPQTAVALPRLMNQRDLALYLGKSTAWCERARWAGEGPSFVKLGRHVRYRAEDVLEWVDSHLCNTGGAGQ